MAKGKGGGSSNQWTVCYSQTWTGKPADDGAGSEGWREHGRHLSECHLGSVRDHKAWKGQPAHNDQGQLNATFL